MNQINRSGLFVLFVIVFSACSSIRTTAVDPDKTFSGFRQDIVSSGRLSAETKQILRLTNLSPGEAVATEGDLLIEALESPGFSELQRDYAKSEFFLSRAIALERRSSEDATRYFLLSIYHATRGALRPECSGPFDIRCDGFNAFYARSVLGVVRRMRAENWSDIYIPPLPHERSTPTLVLRLNRDERSQDPEQFDFLEPSASIELEGLKNRFRRYGVGLSLTACRRGQEDSSFDQYIPRTGICIPLTAVVEFPQAACGPQHCEALVTLWNSHRRESMDVEGRILPLETDFSAPLAKLIERSGLGEWDGFFGALSGNEELLKNTGFYTDDSFDPDKIPLITVHGLFSNPLTWINLQNDLMGDPGLRNRFQVWHYLYPTGLPILVNARDFRKNLDDLMEFVRTNGGKNNMVIVAHSMGGLLTRSAVVQNSDELVNLFFDSPEKIKKLNTKTQDEVTALIEFSKKDYIGRVIFIAVPHRGSSISDGFIGWLGRSLISMPGRVVKTTSMLRKDVASLVRSEVRGSLEKQDHSSVGGLSPRNLTILALSKCSIDESIPFHSIIGDRGRNDGIKGSDGVVPYPSSHLDGAQSELIVPADHTAHAHPLAVREVGRILYEHLDGVRQRSNE